MKKSKHSIDVVANFDAEASTWERHYQSDGNMTARLSRFRSALRERLKRPSQILDFGCGTGALLRNLHSDGWDAVGVDVSPVMVQAARRIAPHLTFITVTPNSSLPFPDSTFSAVVSSSVLEYVLDLDATLAELVRILRPDGILIFTVPDPRHIVRRREKYMRLIATWPPMRRILRSSKWARYFDYLHLSINRMPLETWRGMIERSGCVCDPLPKIAEPLAMLLSRKA